MVAVDFVEDESFSQQIYMRADCAVSVYLQWRHMIDTRQFQIVIRGLDEQM